MSKKEAGIIGLIGAGILGLGLLFGLGGKKSSNDNIIPGGGSGGGLDGYGYNNPIIGGSSAGGGIGSADATKPGTPYVIVNPPTVYGGGSGGGIVSEAPNPDYNPGNVDGNNNDVYGQNSTDNYNRFSKAYGVDDIGNPEDWYYTELDKNGFVAKNRVTGDIINTSQSPEAFIKESSDPNSPYYNPDAVAAIRNANKYGLNMAANPDKKSYEWEGYDQLITGEEYINRVMKNEKSNPPTQTYNNAAEEITHILYDSAPVSSSGSTGNIATSESTPTPPAETRRQKAQNPASNINNYRRGRR